MQLDLMAHPRSLSAMQTLARRAEDVGFDSLWLTESGRTAYLSAAAAALATERIGLGTGIAVAFPRSPMVTAQVAWELAEASAGRFTVGLGTQVKAHIERRYSTEYAPPGPRMADYVRSLRAIFAAFAGREKLSYDGEFYQFSLLPAQWSPDPLDVAEPAIYVSAVLPWMTRMAGELCDGIHIHPFHSPAYLREVVRPNIEAGVERGGRSIDDVRFEIPIMTAVGDTEEEIAAERDRARMMIAFYGSTRTYSPVFEQHGFDGLSDQLHAAQRAGDMATMASLITDEVLDHYIVSSTWSELGPTLVERYRDLAPNLAVMSYSAIGHYGADPATFDRWADVAAAMRAAD